MSLVSHYTGRLLNHLQEFNLFRSRRVSDLIEVFTRRQLRQRVSGI